MKLAVFKYLCYAVSSLLACAFFVMVGLSPELTHSELCDRYFPLWFLSLAIGLVAIICPGLPDSDDDE